MRVAAMRILAVRRAHTLVLLHHFLMFGLLLRALFRGQEGEGVTPSLDREHAEPDLHIRALLQLGFNGSDVGLFVVGQPLSNTNSLGEEIQMIFPQVKVVKTLNTMWCGLMVNPAMIGGGDHTNFICGNDADAKANVKSLLNEFGWKNENLLDLGDITNARGTEAVLPIWLRVWGATQNGAFNFKIVS